VYSGIPSTELWSGEPPPPIRTRGLTVDDARVIIESHEQTGQYRIENVVKDRNGGDSVAISLNPRPSKMAENKSTIGHMGLLCNQERT